VERHAVRLATIQPLASRQIPILDAAFLNEQITFGGKPGYPNKPDKSVRLAIVTEGAILVHGKNPPSPYSPFIRFMSSGFAEASYATKPTGK
jgi:hypothetical protein